MHYNLISFSNLSFGSLASIDVFSLSPVVSHYQYYYLFRLTCMHCSLLSSCGVSFSIFTCTRCSLHSFLVASESHSFLSHKHAFYLTCPLSFFCCVSLSSFFYLSLFTCPITVLFYSAVSKAHFDYSLSPFP